MVLPAREPPLGVVAQLLSGWRAATGSGGSQRATGHIARRVIGRTIALAGGCHGVRMAAGPVGVAATGPVGQTPIDIIAIALLVLRRGERSRSDGSAAARRRAVGARPGQPIQVVVTELLGIRLAGDAGLHAHYVVDRIVSRLRLVQQGASTRVGQRRRGQAHSRIEAGRVAVFAIAHAHGGDMARCPGQAAVGQVVRQRGVHTVQAGGETTQPAG